MMELGRRGDVDVIGTCYDGNSARAAILESKPDLVLLDIKMPGRSGFEVIDGLETDHPPLVIFVTAFERFAVSAFRSDAVDYLLKPIDRNELGRSLDRARVRLSEQDAETRALELSAVLSQMRADADEETEYETSFWVKAAKQNIRVNIHEIEVLEAVRDYVSLHTVNRSYLMRSTMICLEAQLNPDQFVRVHRSFIINLDFVQSATTQAGGGKILGMRSGRKVRVGRTYRDKLPAYLP
jgi:two-component system LytT family response regulator